MPARLFHARRPDMFVPAFLEWHVLKIIVFDSGECLEGFPRLQSEVQL